MASNIEHGYYVRTMNKPNHFRLVWTVENFLDFPAKVKNYLRSPSFSCTLGNDYGMKFYLKMFPKGQTDENEDNVGLFLILDKLLPENVKDVKIDFDISIIDEHNKKAESRYSGTNYFLFDDLKGGRGWDNFITREELRENALKWLVDGHLTLECNVRAHFELKNPVSTVRTQSETGGLISTDLGAEIIKMVYQDKICSDIKLKASNGLLFDAHKCILSARSPYFKAMFQHQMKENEEGLVDLSKDMNGQELEAFLEYIYFGTPSTKLNGTVRKMFQIGDMQGISGLRQLSEQTLIYQLNDDNAMDLLTFANQHGVKELRKAAAIKISNFDN